MIKIRSISARDITHRSLRLYRRANRIIIASGERRSGVDGACMGRHNNFKLKMRHGEGGGKDQNDLLNVKRT
jgi:hypothetical protein